MKSENPSTTISTSEEAEKKHAGELKALEERLRAEHKKELVAATANTVPGGTVEKSVETNVEVAIAAAKAEWEKSNEAKIEEAVERGRMELQAKGRLKDAQLTRTQAKVKELEARLLELQGPGAASTTTTTTAVAASKPATTTAVAATKPATTQAPAQKPTPAQTHGQKPTLAASRPQQLVGQNRLPNRPTPVTRGGGPGRALNATLGGRGGAPTTTAPNPQGTGGGVSIMGAAKRPREDADGETPTTDNSLVKRLKPAENKPTPPIKRPPPKQ